ncbi:hypothetical protein [Streptomyces sp. NPDC056192]|uniref:hypothetical protein n=1 Tax=Streptomyces sp. NPDC056192 TaxID=3345743 RepID=UPI0035DC7659
MLRRLAAASAAIVGLVVLGSSPASASGTVNWKPVNTTGAWHCNGYVPHGAYSTVPGGVKFKTCIVMPNNDAAQAVLVVQNATAHDVYIEKGRVVFESSSGGDIWCAASNLASGATAGCYAPTINPLDCQFTTNADTELTLLGRKNTNTNYGWEAPCG